jgi:N utilization substance protein B
MIEVQYAEEVPVKVTINEAIELAKQYSTEKSPGFINGLLDSLVKDMISEGKVKKIGRGLID